MRRVWIAIAVLVFALGGGDLLAKKPGGGGEEPAPDPAIAYKLGDDLYVMNADGSNKTLLLAGEDAGGGIDFPTWSPDGSQLAFRVHGDSNFLYTLDVDVDGGGVSGSGLTYVADLGQYGIMGVRWSPVAIDEIERIAVSAFVNENALKHLFLVNADGSGDVVDLERDGGYGLSWSPTGDRIAVAQRASGVRVHTLDVDPNGDVYISDSRRYDLGQSVYHPAWSKTQDDVLVVSVANPSSADLWVIDLTDAVATSNPNLFTLSEYVALTDTKGMDDLQASWSPDDTRIVWRSAGRGSPDGIFVLDVDGSADPSLLIKDGKGGKPEGKPFRPAWRRNS